MGQAKQRGNFEQRQAEGIARRELEAKQRYAEAQAHREERARIEAAAPPAVRQRRMQSRHLLNAALAIALSGSFAIQGKKP